MQLVRGSSDEKMISPWLIKINKAKREWWTDKSKEKYVSDPEKLKTHILEGIKTKENSDKINKFFKFLPGETKSAFPKPKLSKDKNKNKIPDYMEKKII